MDNYIKIVDNFVENVDNFVESFLIKRAAALIIYNREVRGV